MSRIITLQLEVTNEEAKALLDRFASQANAYNDGTDDDNTTGGESDGELDDRNVPWHPDFHSKSKAKNADGSWRRRKGGDAAAIEKYEAQFLGGPASAPAPADLPALVTQSAAPAGLPTPGGMPAAQMPTTAAPPAPVTYDDVLKAYQDAFNRVGEAKIMSVINDIYQKAGVADDANKLTTDESARRIVCEELKALA